MTKVGTEFLSGRGQPIPPFFASLRRRNDKGRLRADVRNDNVLVGCVLCRRWRGSWRHTRFDWSSGQFVPAEELVFLFGVGGTHFGHGRVGLRVVVGGVPEQEADATFFFCDSTVGGGIFNTASGKSSTVAGGHGNLASGQFATIPGGTNNSALGDTSFAAGTSAIANYAGSFVWNGCSEEQNGTCNTVQDTGERQFVAAAHGGFVFYTDLFNTAGATLPAGSGSWSSLSDRNAKDDVTPLDGNGMLEKLAAVPISAWHYKGQADSIRHVGPMAQDFHAAFGLGEDDKHISSVDAEGVALAGIQALYKLNQQKDRQIAELSQALAEKSRYLEELSQRLAALEASVLKQH